MVLTICAPSSLEKKTLYKVSILDYLLYSCLDLKFMKLRANKKRKWLLCKQLYFFSLCKSTLLAPRKMS